MDTIWAPWRIQYIEAKKDDGCIFCEKPEQNRDKKNYILYRAKTSFVIMNIYPYISGHLMVAPYRHVAKLGVLNTEELGEIMKVVSDCTKVLEEVMTPQGFNIGANLGKVAGAGIEEHIHIHVVPRWERDTNFMPVISDTRVIPEALAATYDKLLPVFQNLKSKN